MAGARNGFDPAGADDPGELHTLLIAARVAAPALDPMDYLRGLPDVVALAGSMLLDGESASSDAGLVQKDARQWPARSVHLGVIFRLSASLRPEVAEELGQGYLTAALHEWLAVRLAGAPEFQLELYTAAFTRGHQSGTQQGQSTVDVPAWHRLAPDAPRARGVGEANRGDHGLRRRPTIISRISQR